MYSLFVKIKRPLLASALVVGMGMGAASAYDSCNPCRPKPKPVVVRSGCSSNPCAAAPAIASTPCSYAAPVAITSYSAQSAAYGDPVTTEAAIVVPQRVALNPGEEVPYVPGL